MTTEQRGPSAFARAESSSRQVVLQLGLGVLSFVLGTIMAAGAATRIGERIGPIESESLAWVSRWVFQRLWLFTLLPFFGHAIGRFTQIKPRSFVLLGALAGETFSVLLTAGIDGFESLVAAPADVAARVVTLFVGMAITLSAVLSGRARAAEAQLKADAVAALRKAEYAGFLAAAEARLPSPDLKAAESSALPSTGPSPDPEPKPAAPASDPIDPTPGAGPTT